MVTLLIATRNAHKVGEIRAILGEEFHFLTLNDVSNAPEVIEDAMTFASNATKKAVTLAKWLGEAQSLKPGARGDRLYVLADDSGLEVDALGGAPGVHSARYAALDTGKPGNSPTAENNAKLLRLLKDVPLDQRTARFRCLVALTPVVGQVSRLSSGASRRHRLDRGQNAVVTGETPAPLVASAAEGASPVCYANEAELETALFEGTCEGRIGFAPRGQGGFGYDPLFLPSGYEQTFGELSEEVKNRLSHRAGALTKLQRWLQSARANGASA